MKRSNNKVGLIILVVLVAMVLIGGVVFMVRVILSGGSTNDKKPAQQPTTEKVDLLNKPTASTVVEVKTRGPIVARENHYDIDMTISASSRSLKVYQGYDRAITLKEINLDNDQNAFNSYLKALKVRGFDKENKEEDVAEKTDGVCPNGQLIEYIIRDNTQAGSDLWTVSCSDIHGTFGGNSQGVIDLTEGQIPGASDAIRDARRQLTSDGQ